MPTSRKVSGAEGEALDQAAPADGSTSNIGIARDLLLRLRRYTLQLQEDGAARVTQRAAAEIMLLEYLQGGRPPLELSQSEPSLSRETRTLALDRGLLLRFKRVLLDLEEKLGRSISQREVAEQIIADYLNKHLRTSDEPKL